MSLRRRVPSSVDTWTNTWSPTRGISGLSISRRALEGTGICSVAMRMGGSSRSGGSVSHHPRRGSRAASSSTFPYGLYRQKEYLPLLTTIGRAGRAPEKLLLPLTSGYEWPRLILLEGYRRKVREPSAPYLRAISALRGIVCGATELVPLFQDLMVSDSVRLTVEGHVESSEYLRSTMRSLLKCSDN